MNNKFVIILSKQQIPHQSVTRDPSDFFVARTQKKIQQKKIRGVTSTSQIPHPHTLINSNNSAPSIRYRYSSKA
jgi:hypothetical protein